MDGFCKAILSSVISVCHSQFMGKFIKMKTHILLIELYVISAGNVLYDILRKHSR